MFLLAKALVKMSTPEWTKTLNLSINALHTAKTRGHLSPAIAGAIAEELGEDVPKWVAIAAIEAEKESECKDRVMKHLRLDGQISKVF